MPKIDPRFDRLIEEHKALMRDFVDGAEQEYRSYHETAYLLESPANTARLGKRCRGAERDFASLRIG